MFCAGSLHNKMDSHISDQMHHRATPWQANVDSIYIENVRVGAENTKNLIEKQTLKNARSIKIQWFVLFLCMQKWKVTFLIKCTTARHRRKQMWIAYTLCDCARAR